MSAQPQPRTEVEIALTDAFDAADDVKDIVAAVMLGARGMADDAERRGMLQLVGILSDRADALDWDIRKAQKLLGFAEGGSLCA